MSDLELTKLCGQAMGYTLVGTNNLYIYSQVWGDKYDPLNDDAQAMALVKTFQLLIELDPNEQGFRVRKPATESAFRLQGNFHGALNRAIVECVAAMASA